MEVKISQPVFISWKYNNIELDGSWNNSVKKALGELGEEIAGSDLDVLEAHIEKSELFLKNKIGGFAGYSVESPSNSQTDSFYVDFSVITDQQDPYDHKEERQAALHALEALNKYAPSLEESTTLSKCEFDVNDTFGTYTVRAYFVVNTGK